MSAAATAAAMTASARLILTLRRPPGAELPHLLLLLGRQHALYLLAHLEPRREHLAAQVVDFLLLLEHALRIDGLGVVHPAQLERLGAHRAHRIPVLFAVCFLDREDLVVLLVGEVERRHRAIAAHHHARPVAAHHAATTHHGATVAAHHPRSVAVPRPLRTDERSCES